MFLRSNWVVYTYSHVAIAGILDSKGWSFPQLLIVSNPFAFFCIEHRTSLLKYLRELFRQFDTHEFSLCTCLFRSVF